MGQHELTLYIYIYVLLLHLHVYVNAYKNIYICDVLIYCNQSFLHQDVSAQHLNTWTLCECNLTGCYLGLSRAPAHNLQFLE